MSGRSRTMILVLALLMVVGAACTPGWNSPLRRPSVRQPSAINTDPAKMGPITLTVWDQEVRGGQNRQISQLNAEFQRRYPNIRIDRVARSFDDLRNTTKLALTGNRPPDVLQVNNGKQDLGAFVRAGLLLPLDGYATVYRWRARFPASVLRLTRYNDAGSELGAGHLYGVPQTGELVGIYVNREKLDRLGLDPPRTWREFDSALETARRAGELPIQFGNLEKSSGIHLFGFAQNRYVPADDVYRTATGAQGASWQTEANTKAAELLRDWARRGYLTPGFAGLDDDTAWRRFAEGEGVFHISGSWLLADLAASMGDRVGFYLPPSNHGPSTVTGGTGLPFAVSARSRHPDAAAAYLNFISSRAAMKTLLDTENLPVLGVPGGTTASGLTRDVLTAWESASRAGRLVPYLDYATPTAYDAITDGTQRLLSGDFSPQDFLHAMQRDLQSSG